MKQLQQAIARVHPCLDEQRRYRTYPCSQCPLDKCWAGEKPVSARPAMHSGQKRCGHCGTPFTPTGRNLYCTETCRYNAMMRRRRQRRRARQGVE